MTSKQQRLLAQLKTQKILVLGAGLTGISCVRFLQANNISCCLNDSRIDVIDKNAFAAEFPDCQLKLGQWQKQWLNEAEVILLSPGIDLLAEQLNEYINSECLVMGDVELFCQLSSNKIIAVTGSNGKSTVVSLLAHIGDKLGLNVSLGGNIGVPVLDQLSDEENCLILELSSFQLETLSSMQALSASVLNVSDDHLDRHLTLENYSEIKQKVYQQCDIAVVNRDDSFSYSKIDVNKQNFISFGVKQPVEGHFGLAQVKGELSLMFGSEALISQKELPLAGIHNALNYLAALALGQAANWSLTDMIACLSSFTGLAHRCQRVDSSDNINWVNDSKATNVGASIAAINGLFPTIAANNQLILIAGGDGKGADFSPLSEAIEQQVNYLITLGQDGDAIQSSANLTNDCCFKVDSVEQAVFKAKQLAKKGDLVLLSPACASIDMFNNYAERGQRFVTAIQQLQEAS